MWKCLAIAVIFLCAANIVVPLPWQATGASGNSANQATEDAKRKNAPAANSTPVKPPASADGNTNGATGVTGQDKEYSVKLTSLPPIAAADKNKTIWDHVFDWGPWVFGLAAAIFTGLLVIVGWRGVKAANRTLKAVERQGDLMERQIKLQEQTMQQWVHLQGWKVRATGVQVLVVTVDLINPTPLPIKLEDGNATAKVVGEHELGGSISLDSGTFLPPNMPYVIEFPVTMSLQRGLAYKNNDIFLEVSGSFSYFPINGSKEAIVQPFRVVIKCGAEKQTLVAWMLHMNPETKDKQKQREEIERAIEEYEFRPIDPDAAS